MAALANAKHEAFARAIVEGRSATLAYRDAGYKPKSDDVASAAASRLLGDVRVAARVAELKEAAAEKAVMTRAEVLRELSLLGRSNLKRILVRGEDTREVVESLQDLPDEDAAAIKSIVVDTYVTGSGDTAREVKRLRLELHDKRGALSELRRHYEPDRHEHTGKDGGPIETKEVTEFSDIEVARRVAFLLQKAARQTIAGGAPAPEGKDGRALGKQRG